MQVFEVIKEVIKEKQFTTSTLLQGLNTTYENLPFLNKPATKTSVVLRENASNFILLSHFKQLSLNPASRI